jgi:putative aminopeptidase FrvX
LTNIDGQDQPKHAGLSDVLLDRLFAIDSPAGDESAMADFLVDWIDSSHSRSAGSGKPHVDIVRLRDCLVVAKGERPSVALFAHIDTTGFTAGYDGALIPIGTPAAKVGDLLRVAGDSSATTGVIAGSEDEGWSLTGLDATPGQRLVYASRPMEAGGVLRSPYIDNRAGVWAVLKALQSCDRIALALTTGEETSGGGAAICARCLHESLGITKALVSDITWDTAHVHSGKGVAISRRDRYVPSQKYVDRLISLAAESGLPYQIEIESDGGSDGAGIERSGYPIDWAFVGAPEKRPHSACEEAAKTDLEAMAAMLSYLVHRLTFEP